MCCRQRFSVALAELPEGVRTALLRDRPRQYELGETPLSSSPRPHPKRIVLFCKADVPLVTQVPALLAATHPAMQTAGGALGRSGLPAALRQPAASRRAAPSARTHAGPRRVQPQSQQPRDPNKKVPETGFFADADPNGAWAAAV